MNEERKLKVHGSTKPTARDEVRLDAARAAVQHIKESKERQEFEAAKARGITPSDILLQGKRDLGLLNEEPEVDETSDEDADPQKPLDKMNKAELLEVADDEGVEVSDDMTKKQLVEAIEADRKENE